MEARPYQTENQNILKEWLFKRKMDPELVQDIPRVGFIAWDENDPLAAGFIRRVEKCDFGILDGLISNPDCQGMRTNQALDLLVKKISEEAEKIGLRRLLAITNNKHVYRRSAWHGFETLPHLAITKVLGGSR